MSTWIDAQPADKVAAALEKAGDTLTSRYGTDDPKFALWLQLVDNRLFRRTGMGHRDLADWMWFDSFDGGDSPGDAVDYALDDGIHL